MRKLIAVLLILIGIYSPISLFVNIPPFDTDKVLYTYRQIEDTQANSIYNIKGLVYPEKQKPLEVKTTIIIDNPAEYGLVYDGESPYTDGGNWFFPSWAVCVVGISGGMILLFKIHYGDIR